MDVIDFGRYMFGFDQTSVWSSSCRVVLSDSLQSRLWVMAWCILVLRRGLPFPFSTLSQLSKHLIVMSYNRGVRASSDRLTIQKSEEVPIAMNPIQWSDLFSSQFLLQRTIFLGQMLHFTNLYV